MNVECRRAIRSGFRHPFRTAGRGLGLAWILVSGAVGFGLLMLREKGRPARRARAVWLQCHSRRTLRLLGLRPSIRGPVPQGGLLVCNHLSYLDILMISATVPSAFVAKSEVRRWPAFGWFARQSGTVFVDRTRRAGVAHAVPEIESALGEGLLVVIFPEGTSSDGQDVLPFKSSLLDVAAEGRHPVTAARVRYEVEGGGSAGEDVCYWGDMTLLPHLIKLFGLDRVRGELAFGPTVCRPAERKLLALELRAEIRELRVRRTT